MAEQQSAGSEGFLDRVYAGINGWFDREESAEVSARAVTPRESWQVDIGGSPHTIEIRTHYWRRESGPRLIVDGKKVGYLQLPGGRTPRTELEGTLAGSSIVVALEWRRAWRENLRIDLFQDGISLLDGRTLGEARAAAPGPVSRYDTQMSRLQRAMVANFFLVPAVGIGFALSAASACGALGGLMLMAWEMGWFAGTILLNRWNLARPNLGPIRWALFAGFVVAYPALLLLGIYLAVAPR